MRGTREGTRPGGEPGSSCDIISRNTIPNRNSSTWSLSRNISELSPWERTELFDLTSPRAVTDELARIQSLECFLEHLVAIVLAWKQSQQFYIIFLGNLQRSWKIVGILSRLVARYWTNVVLFQLKTLILFKRSNYFCIMKRRAKRSMSSVHDYENKINTQLCICYSHVCAAELDALDLTCVFGIDSRLYLNEKFFN